MADTFEVAITDAGWTDISQGNASGFMTIFGDRDILYRQAAIQPASSELLGHRLSSTSDFVSFAVTGGDEVYARSNGPQALLVVTPTT